MLIIDEGWLALDDKGFAQQLREWLKTLRKKNASVIFATQSLADIDGERDRARHHRELPDAAIPAERAGDRAADHRDLPALWLERPADRDPQPRATPKRDYYCQSRRGNRLFELGLGEVALAFTAASSKSDQAAIAVFATARPREFRSRLACGKGRRVGGRLLPSIIPEVNVMNRNKISVRRRAAAAIFTMILACLRRAGTRANACLRSVNYGQNLLTAARALQQIQNQITSLQNQAQMLINQAKHLEQLPTTVLNDVERDYSQSRCYSAWPPAELCRTALQRCAVSANLRAVERASSCSIRHSLVAHSASRKASRRSLGRKRVRLPRSYGFSFARAASLSERWACR